MRQITADYIFPIASESIKKGFVLIDDDGIILKISKHQIEKCVRVERFRGIIAPGFINAHCHLELSFAKDKIEKYSGINNFIEQLEILKSKTSLEEKISSMQNADRFMLENGVVAVGDICNTDLSRELKLKSKIFYHNFIEVFGSKAEDADSKFETARNLQNEFGKNSSIVAHSPYSVSEKLFKKISNEKGIQSIHHLESHSEIDFFLNAKGDIIRRLTEWGIKIPENIPTKKRPINSISQNLNPSENLILVHNTFINQEDFDFINLNFKNAFFAICALSNDYIENTLPPMKLIMQNTENICIGTDSYASNKSLSVLDELKFIQKHFDIGLADLLKWASLNGAKALKIDNQFGSIEVGKKPALINIENIDFSEMKFTEESRIKLIQESNYKPSR